MENCVAMDEFVVIDKKEFTEDEEIFDLSGKIHYFMGCELRCIIKFVFESEIEYYFENNAHLNFSEAFVLLDEKGKIPYFLSKYVFRRNICENLCFGYYILG